LHMGRMHSSTSNVELIGAKPGDVAASTQRSAGEESDMASGDDDSIMGDEESRSGFPEKAALMVKLRKMKGDVEALERVLSFM
jgi:hypothetical protein